MINVSLAFLFFAVVLLGIGVVLFFLKKESMAMFFGVSSIVSSTVAFLIAIAGLMGVF